jgi:glutathione synthase/RimK-type ligase-like ATP-grasp enzyme
VTTFTVLGCLGDRRTLGFSAACRAEGLPEPELISWARLLDGTVSRPPAGLLRIDSPGGDQDTDTLLRGPGKPARVGGGARWYAAFTSALDRFRAATIPGTTWLNDPADIAVMFDKRRCHARLLAAGVPVPAALGPVSDYAALRAAMASAGWSRVFVKPAHGSSGSGVVALAAHGSRVRAVTSAVPAPDGGYVNSLRAAVYERESEVSALVDALAPDGLHVERWVPKAGIDGRTFDLRVVVIGGVPTHAVVRTSALPITNLQMGGRRGSLELVREKLGADRWSQALNVCARAAACFPWSLMVGVDLLVEVGLRRFYVGEVNAFGDLLPGLTGLAGGPAEGLDTYAAQVRAALGWATRALSLSPSGETTLCGT